MWVCKGTAALSMNPQRLCAKLSELILVWVKDKEKMALDLVPLVHLHSPGSHELSTALRRHWGHLGALGRG